MFWKNRKIIVMIAILLMAYSVTFTADISADDYWRKLKIKADKMYDGFDVSVDVMLNTGYDINGTRNQVTGASNNDKAQAGAGLTMKVPLYSTTDRANKEKEKTAFLEKGSKLIQLIETNRINLEKLKKKEGLVKSMMTEMGIQGINAYYDVCDEITKKEQEIKDAERNLSVILS